MSISVDNATPCAASEVAGASVTVAHTIGSGANSLIVGGFRGRSITGTPTATYNGVAMTSGGFLEWVGIGVTNHIELFYLVSPAAGANNLIVSMTDGTDMICGATSFFGVNQITPIGFSVSVSGSASPATIDVPSATGEVIVDLVMVANAASALTAGQTQQWQRNITNRQYAQQTAPGAITVTMSWTWGGATDTWGIIAMNLKPAITDIGPPAAGGQHIVRMPRFR